MMASRGEGGGARVADIGLSSVNKPRVNSLLRTLMDDFFLRPHLLTGVAGFVTGGGGGEPL